MSDRTCFVCKYHGHVKTAHERDTIYHQNGNPVLINLCYSHSVEFFKFGQKKFIAKYQCQLPQGFESGTPAEKSWFG